MKDETVKYRGLLLKESLEDEAVLNLLSITKTEMWNMPNAADFQPKQWTAIHFEVGKDEVGSIAELLSRALKLKGWYLNMSGEEHEMVVFPNRVFNYTKGDMKKKNEAIEYGKSIGIPPNQLDW